MTEIAAKAPDRPSFRLRPLAELGIVAATFVGARLLIAAIGFRFAGPAAILLTLLVATLLLRRGGESWRELGLRLPAGMRQWLALPLLVVAAMAATFILAVILFPALIGSGSGEGGADAFAFLQGDLVAFLLFMLFVAWGTAAFGEEMLFRGFLQARLETLLGGGRLAIAAALVGQAALFGLGHAYQGWHGILLTGMIGLAMGAVYLADGTGCCR